ncbi:hypothetical protein UPYG_G00035000 [Umbra pygmaea]|uniref:Uncharacterized protein n=1 Tax=Umbra pygmaea TaxID=75934 RepID=A0ABD0Y492_UMBPY
MEGSGCPAEPGLDTLHDPQARATYIAFPKTSSKGLSQKKHLSLIVWCMLPVCVAIQISPFVLEYRIDPLCRPQCFGGTGIMEAAQGEFEGRMFSPN